MLESILTVELLEKAIKEQTYDVLYVLDAVCKYSNSIDGDNECSEEWLWEQLARIARFEGNALYWARIHYDESLLDCDEYEEEYGEEYDKVRFIALSEGGVFPLEDRGGSADITVPPILWALGREVDPNAGPSELEKLLDKVVEDGLLEERANERSGRDDFLYLTEKGKEVFRSILAAKKLVKQ